MTADEARLRAALARYVEAMRALYRSRSSARSSNEAKREYVDAAAAARRALLARGSPYVFDCHRYFLDRDQKVAFDVEYDDRPVERARS